MIPASAERCRLLLREWRAGLHLSGRERQHLGAEQVALDHQLDRLERGVLRVAAVGRVGVGKSSLLNALLERPCFRTDVAHGSTRRQQQARWEVPVSGPGHVALVDTPGIDEIDAPARARLAGRVARGADLVLFVLDGDLSEPERRTLDQLMAMGKPVLPVLNRLDAWPAEERPQLLASLRRRLPDDPRCLEPVAVAAAPRQPVLRPDGRVRSEVAPARIEDLRRSLLPLLEREGSLLLALNALQAADRFHQSLHHWRLRHGRRRAQGLIGRFAALKATGVAANPLLLLDLAGALALDATLVLQLCEIYGLRIDPGQARRLARDLSGQSALLGGVQLGLQAILSLLRQALLLAAPLTGGLSLAPAAPVAVAQAALAVHTTRRTGRLAAVALLRNARGGPGGPGALARRLRRDDPAVRRWLPPTVPARLRPEKGRSLGDVVP